MNVEERVVISDAAWAWEGLRRNRAYRRAWARHNKTRPRICDARASLRYMQLDRPYLEAETFGLITFADPELSASEVPVFWRPDLLRRTLSISLSVEVTGLSKTAPCGRVIEDGPLLKAAILTS